ncbi:MAG: hypothetical protein B0D92_07255 [Spirochaeta sp. LUC14_002_19_P3]|nr:MAG: hypothetical protein B0D92_07255 [Spirochaeta sp. LUC14_002_19_P3]
MLERYRDLFIKALSNYNNDSKWDGALFGQIKIISNTKVGSVGQDFIILLCSELGIKYELPKTKSGQDATQSPWDIKIMNIKFELKTATEDIHNHFQFNHIRYHRTYDALLCLGVSPSSLRFGVWSKADVTTGKAGNLVSMEKNANASYKLTKDKSGLLPIDTFKDEIKRLVRRIG